MDAPFSSFDSVTVTVTVGAYVTVTVSNLHVSGFALSLG